MKILGMKKEDYLEDIVTNTEFENGGKQYEEEELTRHYLFVTDSGINYKITLYEEHGVCPSGVTVASWGRLNIEEIGDVPEDILICTVDKEFFMPTKNENYVCDVFSVNVYGSDEYYPNGFYDINEHLFKKG